MKFRTTRQFIEFLEQKGQLRRIKVQVDPELEITEIASRVMVDAGPALLFENVKGSQFPVAINMFGTDQRLQWALGDRRPEEIGQEIAALIKSGSGADPRVLMKSMSTVKRALSLKPKTCRRGRVVARRLQSLEQLPVLKCWPKDGGRFFTLPLVRTRDPETNVGNCGMYRMQVFDGTSTGMHWHPHRGGAEHFEKAKKLNQSLAVAVSLGGPPSLTFATIAPLPQGFDEYLLAGWLMRERLKVIKLPNGLDVPRDAEFALWGYVKPGETRTEGPFGDHFGYYSLERDFPVFEVQGIAAAKDPIYPATVVGKPPKEDGVLGKAVERMFTPLLKTQLPELVNMNTPLESGFHNLLVASARPLFPRAGVKLALGLWGMGALSLTKTIIIVDQGVDPHDLSRVWSALSENFLPGQDLILIPEGPADTLDIASPEPDRGSKMALDATVKPWRKPVKYKVAGLSDLDHRWESGVCFVSIKKSGPHQAKRVIHRIWKVARPRLLFITDEDVDIHRDRELLWGVFSRFDPKRDSVVSDDGSMLAVDATRKLAEEGHTRPWPDPVEMSPEVVELVDKRWEEYGI